MRYGFFDDDRREYVITRPDTPLPWINYLGSEDYFGIISNTAGGYSFYRDARLRRLTRYRYNNAPLDLGGRYLYLRDDDTGEPIEGATVSLKGVSEKTEGTTDAEGKVTLTFTPTKPKVTAVVGAEGFNRRTIRYRAR